jgi:hypothetical protein
MNPKKLGGKANNDQEPWKMPLSEYIEYLYQKSFNKPLPDDVRSIEAKEAQKRALKNAKKKVRRIQT